MQDNALFSDPYKDSEKKMNIYKINEALVLMIQCISSS